MTVDIEFKRDAIKIKFKKGGGGGRENIKNEIHNKLKELQMNQNFSS